MMRNETYPISRLAAVGSALVALLLAAFGVPAPAWAAVFFGPVQGATATFDLDEAMKVVFEDTLEVNVVTDSELLDIFGKEMSGIQSETGSDGRYIEMAHMLGLPAGYGYRTESDPIPVPSGPAIVNSRVKLKKSVGSVSITGDTFMKVRQGKAAFTTWAQQVFPSLQERIVNTKDRIMLGYSLGIMGRVNTITSGPPAYITVDDTAGIAGWTNTALQFLRGERVMFSASTAGTSPRLNAAGGISVEVLDVSYELGRVYLSEIPVGLTANDYVFAADTAVAGNQSAGVSREFMGLLGHVDNGDILPDYFNIDRDENDQFRAQVFDASGAPYDGKLSESTIVAADIRAGLYGGAKFDHLVASYDGVRQYWDSLKTDRIFNDPARYTGGADIGKGLSIRLRDRVVNLRAARKLPGQVAFGLTKDTFKRYTLGKFQWVSRTGSMWQQVVSNGAMYDAFRAYGVDYDEIFCRKPNKNVRIQSLDPTA